MWRLLGTVGAALLLAVPAVAAGAPADGLMALRAAALAGDPAKAAPWLADDLMLVSQSGKLYGRAEALADLGQGFLSWENRDLVLVEDGALVRASFINRRTRTGFDGKTMPPTDYRVVQLWQKRGEDWKLVLQASVRLAVVENILDRAGHVP